MLCCMQMSQQSVEIAALLIKAGVNCDLVNHFNTGQTALLIACDLGNYEMAKLLIGAGANILASDRHGCTPLLLCSKKKHGGVTTKIAKVILEKAIASHNDPTVPSINIKSMLHARDLVTHRTALDYALTMHTPSELLFQLQSVGYHLPMLLFLCGFQHDESQFVRLGGSSKDSIECAMEQTHVMFYVAWFQQARALSLLNRHMASSMRPLNLFQLLDAERQFFSNRGFAHSLFGFRLLVNFLMNKQIEW